MIIKVLGSGCANCKKVKALAAEVAQALGVEATIQEVTDMPSIMSYGVMSTPGVVINEQLMGSGRVPSKEQMQQFIQQALAA